MNIEESVYLLKYLTKSLKQDEKNQIYKEAIETLLTAYEKEKEKNKKIEEELEKHIKFCEQEADLCRNCKKVVKRFCKKEV